jgi:hypothetical protein
MTDAQGPFFQQGDTGKPTGATAVTAFAYTNKSVFDDIVRRLQNQHRSWLWYKGLNVDLLDSKHASYLTTAVNETDIDHPDLNDTTPAAPAGGLNVKWQADDEQNSGSQTPVSAYVPLSSLATVTIVGTDKIVITDTSDSENPKRGLVSDIITAVAAAPLDAQYVTLATNGTLTNERVLTEGLGIDFADGGAGAALTVTLDLGEISTGTPSGADTFVFVDADDQTGKRGTAADTLVALGAAPSSTAVTAASAFAAANRALISAGADRSADDSDFTLTTDGSNVLRTAVGTDISFDGRNLKDVGTLASGAHTVDVSSTNAIAQSIGENSTTGPWEDKYPVEFLVSSSSATFDIPTASDSTYIVTLDLAFQRDTAGSPRGGAIYEKACWHNAGGTPAARGSIIGPTTVDPSGLGVTAVLSASGTNIRLTVTDSSGATIRVRGFVTVSLCGGGA